MKQHEAVAWVIYPADDESGSPARLELEALELEPCQAGEVLAEPVYGCWEGNMGHAISRQPLDVCRQRGEPKVVIGNAGVVRILEAGPEVRVVEPGQYAMVFPSAAEDRWGYTVKALGYDAAGQSGMLATRVKLSARQLIPLPENTRYSLAQWAAFSVRYVTAWSNWRMAYGVFRLQVDADECPSPHVWGWGGGTTLAELDLARRHGCRVAMLSGGEQNLRLIERTGIAAIDRRRFGKLSYDEALYASDRVFRAAYRRAETAFLNEVRQQTGGDMVQIFIDYLGGPVYRATLKALSREGVIATAGWKRGMEMSHLRSKECIARHQHVYTHYARYSEGVEAVRYAEANGWMPEVDARVYSFEEVPQLAQDYADEKTGYFPCYALNLRMGATGA